MTYPIQTESFPRCLLCGGTGRDFYAAMTDRLHGVPGRWAFSRCPACGLVWLNPRPTLDAIPLCYPSSYFTHVSGEESGLGSSRLKQHLRFLGLSSSLGYTHLCDPTLFNTVAGQLLMGIPPVRQRVLMRLGALVPPYQSGGRLLDIGCGNGSYLALVRQLGWEVAGIEVDPVASGVARESYGIDVHTGSVDDAPFPAGSFDVVTLVHVVEHVPDPLAFLQTAVRFLKPGGRVVVVTPNVQSLLRRICRSDWYALDPPRHLVLFDPRTIVTLLERAGSFRHIHLTTPARLTRDVVRKFLLMRQTGRFRGEIEEQLSRRRETRLLVGAFYVSEVLISQLLPWGEELECVAIKS